MSSLMTLPSVITNKVVGGSADQINFLIGFPDAR